MNPKIKFTTVIKKILRHADLRLEGGELVAINNKKKPPKLRGFFIEHLLKTLPYPTDAGRL